MGEHGDVMYNDTLKGGAFLEFLRERLYLMHKLLSPQGSLYLHIDYKIGHYVKIILDEIFGMDNFRADLSRIKCNPKNFKRNNFGNIKDLILFYTKTDTYIWNEQRGKFSESQIEKLYPKIDDRGNRYTTVPIHAPGATKDGVTGRPWRDILPPEGRHWRYPPQELEKLDQSGRIEWSKNGNPRLKQFAKDAVANGFKFQDILEYKDPFNPKYPTEKNLDLLRMLIRTSSNPNSIILDSFAGSGTTLIAAVQEGRKFIGIDESEHAIRIITDRLQAQTYRDWQLIGNPVVSCK
jgi:adenine-specific DNA-methyltransferase